MSSSTQAGEHHEFQPAFHDERDASSTLFDLRHLIGGLFAFYGLLLGIASFFVSQAKADGIAINLWLGLGMLLLGVFFLAWAQLRPLHTGAADAPAGAEQAAAERYADAVGPQGGGDRGDFPRGQHRKRNPHWR